MAVSDERGSSSRVVRVNQQVLAKNQSIARENRQYLAQRYITSLNLISSPGAGKTFLLEKTLEALRGKLNCAVLVGDQQTDNDAKRLQGKGALVHQIETGNTCHLDATRVAAAIDKVVDKETEFLFIENVGNLICPAAFDLGEDNKVALLSVTEGEDKPVKYPVIFSKVEVVVVTKIDLAPYVEWDREACLGNIRSVCPGVKIFEVSAKSGEGMDQWIDYLQGISKDKQALR